MEQHPWHDKPYYSLDAWCKNTLRHKCYKIALNAHMSCPNRDGYIDTRGCIFCSAGGSGEFAVDTSDKDIRTQLAEGLELLRAKFPVGHTTDFIVRSATAHAANPAGTLETPRAINPAVVSKTPYSVSAGAQGMPNLIAYFQAYTNTYAPVDSLRTIYQEALDCPAVCGISIATRPDCIPPKVLDLLTELKAAYPDKFIWVELGLQTIREQTAQYIRRGYPLSCFAETFQRLHRADIPVIVHLILGLPGESAEDMYQSVSYISALHPFGVKLQLLHVCEGTDLAKDYQQGTFDVLTREQYIEIVIHCLRLLAPDITIHRITGDGPRKILLAPLWSTDKRGILNTIHQTMRRHHFLQGDLSERSIHAARPADSL